MSLIILLDGTIVVGAGTKLLFIQQNFATNSIASYWCHEIDLKCEVVPIKPRRFIEEESINSEKNVDNAKDKKIDETSDDDFKLNNIALSPSGQLLAVSMTDKTLFLFEIKDKNLILLSRRIITRNTSTLKFFPDSLNLIVSDKTGDIFVFNCESPKEPGRWIQGHLSQVLDVLVNLHQKYIISADRDEKIKVSKWPESYEIETYCMGHKEFVSSIKCFCLGDSEYLVSGSGDGTLKVWDFKKGKCLYTVELNSPIGELYLAQKNLNENKLEIVFAVLLRRPDEILFIKLNQIEDDQKFDHKILQKSGFSDDLFVISGSYDASGENFLTMTNKSGAGLQIQQFSSEAWDQKSLTEINKILCSEFKEVQLKFEDALENLYKKKFDNVAEYQEKKRRRIEEERTKKQLHSR